MLKHFSIINILIIIGLIALTYLGYDKYIDSKTESIINKIANIADKNINNKKEEQQSDSANNASQDIKSQTKFPVVDETVKRADNSLEREILEENQDENKVASTFNGVYQNKLIIIK